ncbi:hypothetical protein Vadar_005808 [Vaccinium darrowii]|uniref:Uncharacterized protein n=1 Tax=Vaccinium darrowii TaxID=229202 RepID=A0ACB7WYA5_9ERIC|nr:hypothetical protein Vadar_005808 [Vaccinium darrowii]
MENWDSKKNERSNRGNFSSWKNRDPNQGNGSGATIHGPNNQGHNEWSVIDPLPSYGRGRDAVGGRLTAMRFSAR